MTSFPCGTQPMLVRGKRDSLASSCRGELKGPTEGSFIHDKMSHEPAKFEEQNSVKIFDGSETDAVKQSYAGEYDPEELTTKIN